MSKHSAIALVLAFAAFAVSCDNSFDPKADFEERLVVYAVLSKSQPKQVVRLESSYDAELTDASNPLNKRIITDADVYISDGIREYKFLREDATNPDSPVPYVWASTELIPTEGRNYSMRVVMNGTTVATSKMVVPSRPFLEMAYEGPTDSTAGGLRVGIGRISTVATPKGYYFRLYVAGAGSDGKLVGIEVPIGFDPLLGENGRYVYPSPGRAISMVFSPNYVLHAKDDLEREIGPTDLTLIGIGYSMETNFYNYYKVVRGFDDPVSVRQDNPNITNIQGGLGVFGGMTVDTLTKPFTSVVR